jgi:hypothetical protein
MKSIMTWNCLVFLAAKTWQSRQPTVKVPTPSAAFWKVTRLKSVQSCCLQFCSYKSIKHNSHVTHGTLYMVWHMLLNQLWIADCKFWWFLINNNNGTTTTTTNYNNKRTRLFVDCAPIYTKVIRWYFLINAQCTRAWIYILQKTVTSTGTQD